MHGPDDRDADANPKVAIIIPTLHGAPSKLMEGLRRQTFRDVEIHVVLGERPAGRARNHGAQRTEAPLLLFIDDDASPGAESMLERLVSTMNDDETIAVVGPAKLLSPQATPFQQRVAQEVPRWIESPSERDRESNPPLDSYGYSGITTTCCLIRREVFLEVGGFDEELLTGEDTDLFYRIRRCGYRFIIPADTWVFHDPPGTPVGLIRKSFWYGIGHAQEARRHPTRRMDLLRLGRWYGKLGLALSPLGVLPALFVSIYLGDRTRIKFGFRPLKALSTYATLYGYAWGWFKLGR